MKPGSVVLSFKVDSLSAGTWGSLWGGNCRESILWSGRDQTSVLNWFSESQGRGAGGGRRSN